MLMLSLCGMELLRVLFKLMSGLVYVLSKLSGLVYVYVLSKLSGLVYVYVLSKLSGLVYVSSRLYGLVYVLSKLSGLSGL
jgi:hypothetical protein